MLEYPGPGSALNSVAWVGTLAFALFILVKGFRSSVSRAFSVFALVLVAVALLVNLIDMETKPALDATYLLIAIHLIVAVPFLLLQWLLIWPWLRGGMPTWMRVALVWVPIGVMEVLVLVNPEPWRPFFGSLAHLAWFCMGLAMLTAFLQYGRTPAGPARETLFYVGVGFSSVVLVDVVYTGVGAYPRDASITPLFISWILSIATCGVYAFAALMYVRKWRAAEASRGRRKDLAFFLIPIPAILGALMAGVLKLTGFPTLGYQVWEAAGALACAGGTTLVAYMALKYHYFGLDVKVKWALRRGTVAVIFLAVFFVAAQLAQNFLSERYGWALGGVSAGLLLFAIAPLQRFAEGVADRAMPHVKPHERLTVDERARLYLDQARFAWSDGSLSVKDRQFLDLARSRLGIRSAAATQLEARAVAEASRASPAKPRRKTAARA